jgi:integrase
LECKADLKKIKSQLAGLRFHDLRHHAITELAESLASDSTVMAIAGHLSQDAGALLPCEAASEANRAGLALD